MNTNSFESITNKVGGEQWKYAAAGAKPMQEAPAATIEAKVIVKNVQNFTTNLAKKNKVTRNR